MSQTTYNLAKMAQNISKLTQILPINDLKRGKIVKK